MAVSLGVVLAGLIVLALHCYYYMPFLADDALISLRYSQRLLDGHGLTWTEGRPVEGYSNLLWVLLAALVGGLGVDLVDGLRLLGFASAGLLLGAVVYSYGGRKRGSWLPMAVGMLTLVSASPIAAWTVGGLETILVAALLAWAMVLCYPIFASSPLKRGTGSEPAHLGFRGDATPRGACPPFQRAVETAPQLISRRRVLAASIPLALLCITRPDGALFTATTCLALAAVGGLRRRTFTTALWLAALPAAFYVAQLIFRLGYYGEWVPNTALVKVSPSWGRFVKGGSYVMRGYFALGPVFLLGGLFSLQLLLQRRNRAARARTVLLSAGLVVWSLYIAVMGGDIFPGWRHMLPPIVLLALVLAEGVRLNVRYFGDAVPTVVVPLAAAVMLGLSFYLQTTDAQNRRVRGETWEWDGQVVGLMLRDGFGDSQPLLAVNCAGCLPYWSELPCLDMLGLNDYYLPRHPPKEFGQGWLAHELGDGRYVLDCRPDLIVLGGPNGRRTAFFLGEKQMLRQPEFFERYALVTFEGRTPYTFRSLIWLRKESPKIGIRRTDQRISVPGYLLNANPQTTAYLDADSRFVVPVTPQQPAAIHGLRVPPGRWQIEVEADDEVQVYVRKTGQNTVLCQGTAPIAFEHFDGGEQDLEVVLQSDSSQSVEVRQLGLARMPSGPRVAATRRF